MWQTENMYLCLLLKRHQYISKDVTRRMKSEGHEEQEQGGKPTVDAAKFGRIRNEQREEIHLAKRREHKSTCPKRRQWWETRQFALQNSGKIRAWVHRAPQKAVCSWSHWRFIPGLHTCSSQVSQGLTSPLSGGRLVEEPRPSPLLGRKEDSSDVPHSSSP